MDSKTTVATLKAMCKERGIKIPAGSKKADIQTLLETPANTIVQNTFVDSPLRQEVLLGDTIQLLPTLMDNSAQIIIADPPYNIGKNFGNDSDKQTMGDYLTWCDKWIKDCLRILKPNGTMFIYGFSENLAYIRTRIPEEIHCRWIIWHYTNKNVPSLNFWQRSHESILVLWKETRVFHRDNVREPYTEGFLEGAAGRERKATKGRFQKEGNTETTTYTAHAGGALPRDVIKLGTLAGGGKERHIVRVENGLVVEEHISHETQKPLALCEKLIVSCKQPAADGYVLVPFAGSGSECLAAKNLGLPYIGIELNADYVGLIQRRLAAAEPTMIAAVKATTKAAKAKPSKATEGTHLVPQSS